jgi:hypothetical protein
MRTSRGLFDELGLAVDAATMTIQAGHVEFLAGDPAAAEAELRRGYEVLDRLGDRYWLPSIAALLAHAIYAQGRIDEAAGFAGVAADKARVDDIDAQSLWRSAQAKLRAYEGDYAAAEELARQAVTLLEPTDALLARIAALADLAHVCDAAGRRADAAAAVGGALDLAVAKGSQVLVSRLSELASAPTGLARPRSSTGV